LVPGEERNDNDAGVRRNVPDGIGRKNETHCMINVRIMDYAMTMGFLRRDPVKFYAE